MSVPCTRLRRLRIHRPPTACHRSSTSPRRTFDADQVVLVKKGQKTTLARSGRGAEAAVGGTGQQTGLDFIHHQPSAHEVFTGPTTTIVRCLAALNAGGPDRCGVRHRHANRARRGEGPSRVRGRFRPFKNRRSINGGLVRRARRTWPASAQAITKLRTPARCPLLKQSSAPHPKDIPTITSTRSLLVQDFFEQFLRSGRLPGHPSADLEGLSLQRPESSARGRSLVLCGG